MKKPILTILSLAITFSVFAQNKIHFVPAFEEGFTFPLAEFTNANKKEVVRYTGTVTNLSLKTHVTIAPNFNFSLNTGILNHGFIHNLNDTLKVKQRAYVIPIGAQFTFGDVKNKNFFIGAEAHIPFHYKEKTWVIGERSTKIKSSEWLSSKTEMFSPLVFLGFQFNKKTYIQLKYQLGNFLDPTQNFNFRGINTKISQSNMVSLSFGTIINAKNASGFSKPMDDSKDIEIDI
jgi:hypothetical protein